uniref:Uncharacterized protein n=1 Tax=Anopheles gambiae TaxID=7165 RepID=A0A1S4HED8_ANOGA
MLEGCIRVPPIVWWLYCGCIFEVPATIADRSVAPEPSSAPSGVSLTGGPGSNQSRETKRATPPCVCAVETAKVTISTMPTLANRTTKASARVRRLKWAHRL